MFFTATRAMSASVRPHEVHGCTFTVNNTGALGSVLSKPIVYYSQAAIMTTELVQKRLVVKDDDTFAVRSIMSLCISFNHRINDGSEAAGFLQAVKRRLEAVGRDSSLD